MRLRILGMVVAALACAPLAARADVHITLADGHVTLSAENATIRQILAEWARVGQTRFINAERVSGAPVTLELKDVPEAQALDTVLRTVSGYLAAPRAVPVANASTYDRIYLLPTSSGTTPRPATPPATFAAPPFAQPPVDDQGDDEPRPAVPPQPPANQPAGPRGPAFTTFPQPQPQPRQSPEAPTPAAPATPASPTTFGAPTGGGPTGVSVPGMVVPVPQPQQDPANAVRR